MYSLCATSLLVMSAKQPEFSCEVSATPSNYGLVVPVKGGHDDTPAFPYERSVLRKEVPQQRPRLV